VEKVQKMLSEALQAIYRASHEDKCVSRADGLIMKKLDGPESRYFGGRSHPAWQAVFKPPLTGQEANKAMLDTLTEEEKACIPLAEEIHFTVISGFRTRSVEGITDILRIQNLYNDAGVVPTWYVDNECVEEYRKLGLKAVKAGKLIPARNRALEDAVEQGKVCVQTSDDIGTWTFVCDQVRYTDINEANAAWRAADKCEVSPVAAAQYLLARMRSRGPCCRLGGVYPLGNGGRAMGAHEVFRKNFILGDFFASEVSDCRFDERLTLKEDYDFTASHLSRYGEVLRCNRMLITAKHETNAGGACDARDAAGLNEQRNIKILKEKWPGSIWDHPSRANQVTLNWRRSRITKSTSHAEVAVANDDEDVELEQDDA
jgi:hypothetical protein